MDLIEDIKLYDYIVRILKGRTIEELSYLRVYEIEIEPVTYKSWKMKFIYIPSLNIAFREDKKGKTNFYQCKYYVNYPDEEFLFNKSWTGDVKIISREEIYLYCLDDHIKYYDFLVQEANKIKNNILINKDDSNFFEKYHF